MEGEKEEYLEGLELTSGFSKPPKSSRGGAFQSTPERWLDSVRELSNIGPYWRIHDKLYDLTDYVDRHPGGKFWLESTKGMDITDAFVSAHLSDMPETILKKYYVKDVLHTPRFSPFTFKEDGFYMTLRRKAQVAMKGIKNGPTAQMKLIQDSLFVAFLSTLFYACINSSIIAVIVAGLFSTLSANCAHNFFHQKDNWRMYIFDFGGFYSADWRITHAISHHLFPNTVHDYEIFANQPIVELYPIPVKSLVQKYAFMPVHPYLYGSFLTNYFVEVFHVFCGEKKFKYPMLIQPLLFTAMVFTSKSFLTALLFWVILQATFNFIFLWIGWNGGHHSNYSYVDGDPAIKDRDWGLHQIMAVAERKETLHNLPLASVTFGNHTLHHMFPTIDHSLLHLLLPPLLETCEEFNVDFKIYSTWEVFCSIFYRFYTTKPNAEPSKLLYGKGKK